MCAAGGTGQVARCAAPDARGPARHAIATGWNSPERARGSKEALGLTRVGGHDAPHTACDRDAPCTVLRSRHIVATTHSGFPCSQASGGDKDAKHADHERHLTHQGSHQGSTRLGLVTFERRRYCRYHRYHRYHRYQCYHRDHRDHQDHRYHELPRVTTVPRPWQAVVQIGRDVGGSAGTHIDHPTRKNAESVTTCRHHLALQS